ncbi:RING finger protein 145-like isoform X3 [Eriocheir sinensis]|uniref:RING finger protein 145-like isoform X3 n=1 Tax=Eriocheir sinensis TaxID=95602 RepID=UPI0021C9ABCC|nr:RING finger protein 145-like isoform X3 [Eriocheir sinensis]
MATRTSVLPAGSNKVRAQEVAVPGAPYLLLLLGMPFVLYLARPCPSLLFLAALCYLLVVLPRALGPQLPQASPLWLPRTIAAVLLTRGWATSLGRWAAGAVRGVVVGVRFLLVGVVRACVVLPVALSVAVTLAIHETYMSLYGARITANQVVFFLMVQELVTPWAHLTSLYFLLFYTVLVYIHRALFGRHWAMRVQVGQSHDLARLAVWYIATRLGKGVAMSFVLVMFTLQFSHVEPDLTFISITFTYFILTQHKWTGEERIITWIRALRLPPLEEEEDFWVPLGALVLPLVMSAGVAVVVAPSRPWLVVVAAYTNLLVPGLVVAQRVAGRDSPHAAVLTACRKATPKELEDRPTCPVCLEELRQARVTPCLHLYHASCLASCLAHSSLCPLCKQHI